MVQCLRVRAAEDIDAFATGWAQAFGRPMGSEKSWLLERSTTLTGGFDCAGRMVAGVGMRCSRLEYSRRLLPARLVHDVWVAEDWRRRRVFTSVLKTATERSLAGGDRVVMAIAARRRGTLRAFQQAGYDNYGTLELLRGPTRGFAGQPVDQVRVTGNLSPGGWAAAADLLAQNARPGRPRLHRDEDYLRARFDKSPRPYLVATVGGSGARLRGLSIGKHWPRRSSVQVVLAAGDPAARMQALAGLARCGHEIYRAEMLDLSSDAAHGLADDLTRLGFTTVSDDREVLLRVADGGGLPAVELMRDEINSF